jgi:hypothetical protein
MRARVLPRANSGIGTGTSTNHSANVLNLVARLGGVENKDVEVPDDPPCSAPQPLHKVGGGEGASGEIIDERNKAEILGVGARRSACGDPIREEVPRPRVPDVRAGATWAADDEKGSAIECRRGRAQ